MSTTAHPRLSDFRALQKEAEDLRAKLSDAEQQRDDARHEAEELRAQRDAANRIVHEANARAEAAAKTVMERATAALATRADERDGPSADEPRWRYKKGDPTEDRLFANKAEADAAAEAEPGCWFDSPTKAQQAHAAEVHAPLRK